MWFRVGDKVRIIANDDGSEKYIGKIGKICATGRIKRGLSIHWDYECKFEDEDNYPFRPEEMEKIFIKGEQLLFEFMV